MAKCVECTKPAVAYCVEQDKTYCNMCVGRLFIPPTKLTELSLEEIDTKHTVALDITKTIMYVTASAGMLSAFWMSGVTNEYFKGSSICPGLSVARQALVKFDTNVFYYYKQSLATYCDIEDSFWRLLMDGWVRGVVSGSDSLLLLASTLPMALMFKIAVSTFLRPIYATIYALVGMTLSFIISELEDGSSRLYDRLPGFLQKKAAAAAGKSKQAPAKQVAEGNAAPAPEAESNDDLEGRTLVLRAKALGSWVTARVKTVPDTFSRVPRAVKTTVTTKSTFFDTASMIFMAIGYSAVLRLILHHFGFDSLAGFARPQEVNLWQLLFEPLLWFYFARMCTNMNTKLAKSLWKKAAAPPPPRTLRRIKPARDVKEWIAYKRSRFTRVYNHYWGQAEAILRFFVEDVFYSVVLLRLAGIVFGLAPFARKAFGMIGFGGVIDNHRSWFFEATGFRDVESDVGAKYLTDRLALWGSYWGFGLATVTLKEEAAGLLPTTYSDQVGMLYQAAWHIGVPLGCWWLHKWWQGVLKQQNAAYMKEWKGDNWKTGKYAEMLDKLGSYWKPVTKDEWMS
mmetsp:Transcript_67454/g.140955  ORF Transcript_67454/g.140955 Transcript_67454/m.140955 type:complete len:567 (+) Transcript_67454:180-1880(+)